MYMENDEVAYWNENELCVSTSPVIVWIMVLKKKRTSDKWEYKLL